MQNRAALISIKNEPDLREVYAAAYGNYIWKQSSGNLIRTKKNDIDLNDLAKAIDLVNYFAAQYLALKKDELELFLKLPFDKAIDTYYDNDYFGSLDVEIHSPGIIGRVMKTATLAAYVSSMLAISAEGITAQEAKTAIVQNSASSVPTACDLELEKDIRETMILYANYDLWEKVNCTKSKTAKDNTGLESDVRVKKQLDIH